MPTERQLIEAKLRELVRAAETVAGCALEETLAPGDWADVLLAALKESRKADIEAVKVAMRRPGILPFPCSVAGCDCRDTIALHEKGLAALSRLAGDE